MNWQSILPQADALAVLELIRRRRIKMVIGQSFSREQYFTVKKASKSYLPKETLI
jgi:hypothetical protein